MNITHHAPKQSPEARLYYLMSALLAYPEPSLIAGLSDIDSFLSDRPAIRDALDPLLERIRRDDLIDVQERYVSTFDRHPGCALYLFEHVHGESRDRGQAMVDLLDEYRRRGWAPMTHELPDHIPAFLEFLGVLCADGDQDEAERWLGDAIDVLAAIGDRLQREGSPYAAVFAVLRSLTTVQPKPQPEPPVRDMDEAMERFGPGVDGVEPLLTPAPCQPLPYRARTQATPSP
ncbi:nitrate reductase molybdenum cofactor assembly chaperone [Dyella solisilvae]|uniref:Nitrate reductase molybdenum cofactor assembly chaperone n=1 Tax=Dyella solisilvae TaxID=1920168 RepID=A0A370K644_9GAMM|nr:nitrate reductase molybdenum cofactor assembly chaperone [Dyella solisilvae]RDI98121.1 nitrate reductase molybdenum cofactor assembly chaperone [Dyella solisilvae]